MSAIAKVAQVQCEVRADSSLGPNMMGSSGISSLNLPKAHIFFDFIMASLEVDKNNVFIYFVV